MDSGPSSSPSSFAMLDAERLNVYHFPNEYPTDDVSRTVLLLRRRSKNTDHLFLRLFLEDATITLRKELCQLPEYLRATLPPFENILDLVNVPGLRKLPLGTFIESLMVLVVQLGLIIGHYDENPPEYKFSKSRSCFTGIGPGLMVGAALAVSPQLSDLPAAGAEVIRMAARLEILTREVADDLEAVEPGETPASWAILINGLDAATVRKEVDTFNTEKQIPPLARIFISSESAHNILVSGPPSHLRNLFSFSEKLRYSRFFSMPIYGGPCHAPHIYNASHVQRVIGNIRPSVTKRVINLVPFVSMGTGEPYQAVTPREVFECVLGEILTGTVRWSSVVQYAVERVHSVSTVELQLHTLHDYHATQELVATMESNCPSCAVKSFNLQDWILGAEENDNARPIGTADCKIAIIGMSCRFPGGANDADLYWELLAEGRDVHRKIPPDRYDVDSHTDPTGARRNTSLTPFGCFIDEPGLFDAGFFNMSPREAAGCDPMHRLALVTAYEALEQSGYAYNRTPSTNQQRVATFYGQASDDYREVNAGQEVDTYYIPGGCRAFAPGRINYFFKFSGPSFDCDTACSSSLATIQIACTSLENGDSDMIVAGGLNVLTNSDGFAGLSRGHFLSKTGGCKTWDANADGYCRADGVGSIIMKRLTDAEADNDNILGIICSSATNHSANAISITHPHAPTQSDLYRLVLGRAGIDAEDVDFVEFHGTGTQAGDATEMESVTAVFAPAHPRRKRPLSIGAVKGNVGHGEAAAGIMAFIKTLLVFKHNLIPPHVGVKTELNPAFPDLEKINVKIPWEGVPWERSPERKRYAIVNNFSAAGGNTTLVVEEPPIRTSPEPNTRAAAVIAVTAKSKKSFRSNIERLIEYISKHPNISLTDLSYTTTARRMHHNHRIATSGKTLSQIQAALEAYLPSAETQRPVSSTPPSVAYVFSGQGTIHSGMARELFEQHSGFRSQILQLDSMCKHHGFPSFVPLITDQENKTFAPIVNHLTLVAVGIALVRLLDTLGIRPSAVLGASLGEYAALYAAGVLSASDALLLAGRRAILLQEKCAMDTHAMCAIRGTADEISEHASGVKYGIACYNGRRETCISSTVGEVVRIRGQLEAAGYQCHQLDVPFAFHSPQMDPILDDFERTAEAAVYKAPTVPIISSLLGDCVFDSKTINANYMRRATRETVQFIPAVDKAWEDGILDSKTILLEIGPQPTFVQFIKNAIPEIPTTVPTCRRGEDNFVTMSASLSTLYNSGIEINWNEWHRPFESQLRLLDDLPAYSWNNKNYWIQYEGDWMLSKNLVSTQTSVPTAVPSTLRTSLVHQVLEEEVSEEEGYLVVRSDLMQPEFLEAANGHRMNGHGVVTSSIHADVGFTIGKHLWSRIRPGKKCPGMNMKNLHVLQGLIVRKNKAIPQQIEIVATANFKQKLAVKLQWFNVDPETGDLDEGFASAEIEYGDNEAWLAEWSKQTHLITSRIQVLDRLADEGVANRLSRDLAYTLFANLVDYAERYRGMRQVVLNGFEASANVTLTTDAGGSWTLAPHHIDSVAHLAGFILNGGNAADPRNNFFVTPGWKAMRFAKPLVGGGQYQSYVRMVPQAEAGFYAGDVYILQDGEIIGLVEEIQFRTFPRLLLGKLFSPSDMHKPINVARTSTADKPRVPRARPAPEEKKQQQPESRSESAPPTPPSPTPPAPAQEKKESAKPVSEEPAKKSAAVAAAGSQPDDNVLALIAAETSMDIAELNDETEFASIGVDSLLSLVLAEKFRDRLGFEIKSSLFIECVSIGGLKGWLAEYC